MTDPSETPSQESPKKGTSNETQLKLVAVGLSIPSLLIAGPLVGYGIGWVVDVYCGLPEGVRGIGLLLGFVSGAHQAFILLKKISSDMENEK